MYGVTCGLVGFKIEPSMKVVRAQLAKSACCSWRQVKRVPEKVLRVLAALYNILRLCAKA